MPLFSFVQAEFPWALGPSDGRYLLRDAAGGEPQFVVVLSTLGAPRRGRLGARRRTRPATPDPAPVATARATMIPAQPLPDERTAGAWLQRADAATIDDGLAVINRVLFAQRIAAADPSVHEVRARQALVLRAGYGDGEAVADGRWLQAREIVLGAKRQRRTAALRPQERLGHLLTGRHSALAVEEFALRARADLDAGRLQHAAAELSHAYSAGLPELEAEERADLAPRLAELRELAPSVAGGDADPERLEHALTRLEAALRARTASGFDARR
jgi:hypothetical protein